MWQWSSPALRTRQCWRNYTWTSPELLHHGKLHVMDSSTRRGAVVISDNIQKFPCNLKNTQNQHQKWENSTKIWDDDPHLLWVSDSAKGTSPPARRSFPPWTPELLHHGQLDCGELRHHGYLNFSTIDYLMLWTHPPGQVQCHMLITSTS